MDEREMLELAAKAANLPIWFDDNGTPWYDGDKFIWNPLHDDGDALRLAVKMRMLVKPPDARNSTAAASIDNHILDATCTVEAGDDPYAATRLAIVRAAAEIGKLKSA